MSRAIFKMRGKIDPPIVIVGSVAGNVVTLNDDVHNLGTIDVGLASDDKNILLGINWSDNATRTITGLTVGGVALSETNDINSGGSEEISSAIWVGDISSINGSQAIVATFNANTESSGVSAVAIEGLQSLTPTMEDTDSTQASAQMTLSNLAALAGGITFACGGGSEQAAAATWGSLTERADVNTGTGGNDLRHTAAWDLGVRSAADETLDFQSGTTRSVAGAGFR